MCVFNILSWRSESEGFFQFILREHECPNRSLTLLRNGFRFNVTALNIYLDQEREEERENRRLTLSSFPTLNQTLCPLTKHVNISIKDTDSCVEDDRSAVVPASGRRSRSFGLLESVDRPAAPRSPDARAHIKESQSSQVGTDKTACPFFWRGEIRLFCRAPSSCRRLNPQHSGSAFKYMNTRWCFCPSGQEERGC